MDTEETQKKIKENTFKKPIIHQTGKSKRKRSISRYIHWAKVKSR